jgi:hypothetical protein
MCFLCMYVCLYVYTASMNVIVLREEQARTAGMRACMYVCIYCMYVCIYDSKDPRLEKNRPALQVCMHACMYVVFTASMNAIVLR